MGELEDDIIKVQKLLFYEATLGGVSDPQKYQETLNIPVTKVNDKKEILVVIESSVLDKFKIDLSSFTAILHYLINERRLPVEITFQRDLENEIGNEYPVDPGLFHVKIPIKDISTLKHKHTESTELERKGTIPELIIKGKEVCWRDICIPLE